MLTVVIGGLIVSALSGLSFLAYHNPSNYRRIGALLLSCIVIAFAVVAGWCGGMIFGRSLYLPYEWLFVLLLIASYLGVLFFIRGAKAD